MSTEQPKANLVKAVETAATAAQKTISKINNRKEYDAWKNVDYGKVKIAWKALKEDFWPNREKVPKEDEDDNGGEMESGTDPEEDKTTQTKDQLKKKAQNKCNRYKGDGLKKEIAALIARKEGGGGSDDEGDSAQEGSSSTGDKHGSLMAALEDAKKKIPKIENNGGYKQWKNEYIKNKIRKLWKSYKAEMKEKNEPDEPDEDDGDKSLSNDAGGKADKLQKKAENWVKKYNKKVESLQKKMGKKKKKAVKKEKKAAKKAEKKGRDLTTMNSEVDAAIMDRYGDLPQVQEKIDSLRNSLRVHLVNSGEDIKQITEEQWDEMRVPIGVKNYLKHSQCGTQP